MKKFLPLCWLLLVCWLACWLYASRFAMLDDALIHLRYAAFLHDQHRVTYDGITASYGTSSLIYVTLLALLRSITISPMLPKTISCIFYLLVILYLLDIKNKTSATREARFVWMALLAITLSPMAIRWLTDGMETSLVVLMTIILSTAVWKFSRSDECTVGVYLWLATLGFLMVLLRTELAALSLIATCASLASRWARRKPSASALGTLLSSTPLAVGAFLGMALIWSIFGRVLPDTAVAKSSGFSLRPLDAAAHVIASSFCFGCGALLLFLLSAWLWLRVIRRSADARSGLPVWLIVNSCFPIVLVLSCMRGQAVQGVRYFLWPLFFSIVWNLLTLGLAVLDKPAHRSHYPLAWGLAIVLILLFPADWHYASRAMSGRAQTFLSMRDAGLSRYRDRLVIAGDIGFIGYFTGAEVCDLSGLVNGLQAAALPTAQRARRCVEQKPGLLFVTESQRLMLAPFLDFTAWAPALSVDFQNVNNNDRHILFLPKEQ